MTGDDYILKDSMIYKIYMAYKYKAVIACDFISFYPTIIKPVKSRFPDVSQKGQFKANFRKEMIRQNDKIHL